MAGGEWREKRKQCKVQGIRRLGGPPLVFFVYGLEGFEGKRIGAKTAMYGTDVREERLGTPTPMFFVSLDFKGGY